MAGLLLTAVLTACSMSDEYDGCTDNVTAQLSFAVSKSASSPATRQSDGVVQAQDAAYRGLELLRIIPFGVSGRITAADAPKYFGAGTASREYAKSNSRFIQSTGCSLQPGTASFLVYGRAPVAAGASDADNGKLEAAISADGRPEAITFSPVSMCAANDVPDDARKVADYLTNITNAAAGGETWKNSRHSVLMALLRNFTGQDDYGTTSIMAGSSANARRHVANLRDVLNGLPFADDATAAAIKSDILARIADTSLLPATDYPASIGLPDGTAALRWDGSAFVPQTETTTQANINNVNRFCYPAELYYYVNSQINTSNLDDRGSYYESEDTWEKVLEKYEYNKAAVSNNTKAVAIIEPLRYAVGCLQVRLNKLSRSVLKDSKEKEVAVGATSFPLTGVIVGGQHQVDFDFKPKDTPDRFVYDSQVKSGIYLSASAASEANNTLVLQSPETDDEIPIILEFRNDSGTDFCGVGGHVVYQGTKFYLMGTIRRPEQTAGMQDYQKRVFTQHYTTLVGIDIASLREAYNVLPDLLASSLEIGIQLTPQWVQATTTIVIL